jgi:hypothetical protein
VSNFAHSNFDIDALAALLHLITDDGKNPNARAAAANAIAMELIGPGVVHLPSPRGSQLLPVTESVVLPPD